MSEFKTLVYDFVKLFPPKKLSLNAEALPTFIDHPYVNVPRERLRAWANDYKILYEFSAEVLGKRDFDHWDILKWYRIKADELEKKRQDLGLGG